MTLEELRAVAEIVEKLTNRYRDQADARVREELHRINVELRAEVAALKSQTPQHPVKVGEWVRRTKLPGDQTPVGFVKQVTAIDCDGERYHFSDGDYWSIDNCEPCAHQHPAQDGQWVRRTVASGTEPVGTMIQIGRSRTLHEEYVTRGVQVVPWAHCEPCEPPIADHDTPAGKEAAEAVIRGGVVGKRDVRKVPQ